MLESQSPLRTCGAENTFLGTPSKDRTIMSPSIGDEENQENRILNQPERRLSKRVKVEAPSPVKMTALGIKVHNRSHVSNDGIDFRSDCGTEASSTVSARKEWLKQFGKRQKDQFRDLKNKKTELPPTTTPPKKPVVLSRSTVMSPKPALLNSASAASTLVNRMVSEPAKRNFSTPIRNKTKILRHEEIQATNEGYASVSKLSQWLANDPTSIKKKRHVRKGRNVISKSRKFEKDMENVIIVENNISKGSVLGQKKWLQGAFQSHEDDGLTTRYAKSEAGAFDSRSTISVSAQKDWLKKAFKKVSEESNNDASKEESRSEIITDDAASSMSVSCKKDWLKTAFKSQGTPGKKTGFSSGYSKARTDIMHCRGEGRDEIAARAKRKFLERRRAERGGSTTPTKVFQGVDRAPQSTRGAYAQSMQPESEIRNVGRGRTDQVEERTGPPSGSIMDPIYQVDEDTARVNFSAARKLLVQRGKNNGHNTRVLNKVDLRKNKFEKMETDIKRRSGAKGLLKPAWEQADSAEGRPSNAYDKKYLEDIAPKRSFEELP